MLDRLNADQRFAAMSANRGRTKPERRFASMTWRSGWRYYTAEGYARLVKHRLLGNPDLIFPRLKVAIFVDGCFWHGCPTCKRDPGVSGPFWVQKIATNVSRDRHVTRQLRSEGWKVIRVWEHQVVRSDRLDAAVASASRVLTQRKKQMPNRTRTEHE